MGFMFLFFSLESDACLIYIDHKTIGNRTGKRENGLHLGTHTSLCEMINLFYEIGSLSRPMIYLSHGSPRLKCCNMFRVCCSEVFSANHLRRVCDSLGNCRLQFDRCEIDVRNNTSLLFFFVVWVVCSWIFLCCTKKFVKISRKFNACFDTVMIVWIILRFISKVFLKSFRLWDSVKSSFLYHISSW